MTMRGLPWLLPACPTRLSLSELLSVPETCRLTTRASHPPSQESRRALLNSECIDKVPRWMALRIFKSFNICGFSETLQIEMFTTADPQCIHNQTERLIRQPRQAPCPQIRMNL